MQRVPVFVLSLARSVERRDRVKRHLDRIGLSFEFVDGVDGRAMSQAERRQVCTNDDLPPGHVGCCLSHFSTLQRIVDEDIPVALILEDDIVLDRKVMPILEQKSFPPFDFCFLGSEDRGTSEDIFYDADTRVDLAPGYPAARLSGPPYGSSSYLVSKAGAAKRLEEAIPIREAIDCYTTLEREYEFWSLVRPRVAWLSPVSLASTIVSPTVLTRWDLFLRHHKWFFPVRDALKLRALRKRAAKRRLIEKGWLSRDRRWRALPWTRDILYADV